MKKINKNKIMAVLCNIRRRKKTGAAEKKIYGTF